MAHFIFSASRYGTGLSLSINLDGLRLNLTENFKNEGTTVTRSLLLSERRNIESITESLSHALGEYQSFHKGVWIVKLEDEKPVCCLDGVFRQQEQKDNPEWVDMCLTHTTYPEGKMNSFLFTMSLRRSEAVILLNILNGFLSD